jgi:hypothetical protein
MENKYIYEIKFLTAENMKISLLGYCVVDSLIN